MKTKRFYPFFSLALLASISGIAQDKVSADSTKVTALDEILVASIRVNDKAPIAYSNLNKAELAKRNLGQDIPSLMNFMPSVVMTTDAGNGVGYSSIRVRGSDATRVNVTLNGIPYNDGESQGSFWVNMPDFASSVQNIQLQRGVGTSTNGSAAFGASLNLLTDSYSTKSNGEISNAFGSYNTRKHTVKFSTGLMNDHFEIAGRLSNIHSDGYIDRATSDMKSYFLQGTYLGKTTLIKALAFGGDQKTYQAWNGLEDPELLAHNRRFNTSGVYYDQAGNRKFYDDETDNYKQDHFQLHWNERWSSKWSTNAALHYTMGKGYYENYKVQSKLAEYGLDPIVVNGKEVKKSDVVRQKWLDNDFYGFTFSAHYKATNLDVVIGGAANKYEGSHFGNILWVKEPVAYEYKQKYYDDDALKTDVNTYAKATYQFASKWSLYGDLQFRSVHYKANGLETGNVNDTFDFFNPKAGITFQANAQNQWYFSYARANREPNRNDYKDGSPKPEKLNDFELGWRFHSPNASINVNAYYMRYKDQLVLTGALNDVGAAIRENSGDSYRLGLEVEATVRLLEQVYWSPSITVSNNKNVDFHTEWNGELVNLGNTNIAFSPNFIASNALTYIPVKGLNISWLTKFVGEQYMGNVDMQKSKLDAYFVNDLSVNYEFPIKGWFESIGLSVLANNIFDVKYLSNGFYYTYDEVDQGAISTVEGAGYYPQATFNILGGVTLKF
ncbi:TonB-dependent receptor [Flavobacterium sp. JP2137]|uniref:TonB-dependent receptor n=1 Tax=Flavobacterium sp. JP2137 TaxID=3414510 RepID=UPI003D2FFA3F